MLKLIVLSVGIYWKPWLAECKDKSKCWASFLFNSKGYKAKACWDGLEGWGILNFMQLIKKLKKKKKKKKEESGRI